MSKFTAPVITAALAGGLTALLWTSILPATKAEELAVLRRENVRLTQALSPGASAEALAAIAGEFDAQTSAVARAVERKRDRSPQSTSAAGGSASPARTTAAAKAAPKTDGHRDRGQATPHDAFMSVAWGSDAGEVEALAKMLWFDPEVRPKADAVLAGMPEGLRASYRTPEELFALIFAAEALVAPPPGADLIEHWEAVELRPGRAALRAPGQKPGYDYHQYQQTSDGWKYVVPDVAVEHMPKVLQNETLGKLGQP